MTFPLISSPGRKVLDNLSSLISMLVEDMTDTQLLSNNFQSEEERSLSDHKIREIIMQTTNTPLQCLDLLRKRLNLNNCRMK